MNKDFRIAYDILDKVFRENAYSNIMLTEVLDKTDNRALVTKLVYGTLEKNVTLDYYISLLCKSKPQNKVLTILKLGIYMQKFTKSIPSHAIVNEMVNLTEYIKKPALAGFVNATLKKAYDMNFDLPKDEKKAFSVKYSVPEWLVQAYFKQYGKQKTQEILCASAFEKEHIRPNLRNINLQQLKMLLRNNNIDFEESDFCGLFVKNNKFVRDLYDKGMITYQSPSSMLVCEACAPCDGDVVLDMCSAPGGKAVYLDELANDLKITACDLYENRVQKIQDYSARMKCKNIDAVCFDGTVFNKDFKEKFDLVLCDSPCSGFGVARKKPDIYLNKSIQDIQKLSEIQYILLNNAIDYTKKGGHIVYSTCTLLREENYNIIGKTLKYRQDVKLEKMPIKFENSGYLQLLPNSEGVDGFFIARLVKC